MAPRIAMLLLSGALGVAALTDWRRGRIPNWLTLPAMLAGLALWSAAGVVAGGWPAAVEGLGRSGLALAAGAGLMVLLQANGGDVKLLGAVGALSADWRCVLATAAGGFLIAAIMAMAIMVRRRIVLRTLRRIGWALVAVVGRSGVPPAADSPTVPLGTALALAGLLAGAEFLLGLAPPWSRWGF